MCDEHTVEDNDRFLACPSGAPHFGVMTGGRADGDAAGPGQCPAIDGSDVVIDTPEGKATPISSRRRPASIPAS